MTQLLSYTTIDQSKRLAEFLPIESADQTWERIAIAGANLSVPEELQYRHNGDMQFKYYSGIGIPCWSLSALLDILPKQFGRYTKSLYWFDEGWHCEYLDEDHECKYGVSEDNHLDACYEMIIKLKEQNLL